MASEMYTDPWCELSRYFLCATFDDLMFSLLIHFRLVRLLSIIVHVPMRTVKEKMLFDKRDTEIETFTQARDTRRHLEVESLASKSEICYL